MSRRKRHNEYRWVPLADYNAEVARGIVHTPEYDAKMADWQRSSMPRWQRSTEVSPAACPANPTQVGPPRDRRRRSADPVERLAVYVAWTDDHTVTRTQYHTKPTVAAAPTAGRVCVRCGRVFHPIRGNHVICSDTCRRPPRPARPAPSTAWMERAACAGSDPDLFFPSKGTPTIAVRAVCGACPVRVECLEWALAVGETEGFWGGMSARGRRRLRVASR